MSHNLQAKVVVKKNHFDGEQYQLQWRRCSEQGRWLGSAEHGDIDALKSSVGESEKEVCLLLPGTDVVCEAVNFNKKEKKHLANLIPFELEEDLAVELDDLHFSYAAISDENAVAAYTDFQQLRQLIDELEACGLVVNHCLPESMLIERLDNGWGIQLDDNLHVHYGEALAFSVDRSLATAALTRLSQQCQPEHLLLMAADPQQLEELRNLLPLALTQHLVDEQIDTKICDQWESINFTGLKELDLRQGQFARQLPFLKWWDEWRNVAIVAGIAFVAFLGLNIAQIQINNAKDVKIRGEITQVYRQVVPQGAATDPEKQLKQKLSTYEGASSGGSVVTMLAKVAPLIARKDDINLQNVRYNNQRGTMDLTLTAKSSSEALELSNDIQSAGLGAQLNGVNDIGDEQQIRMVITRAVP